MPFQQKSIVVMTGALVVAFGAYFAIVGAWVRTSPARDIAYIPLLGIAVALVVVLAIVGHIVVAALDPTAAGAEDERDRRIAAGAERVGGYVLAAGVFGGIALAMVRAPQFYIANGLLLALVAAQLIEYAIALVRYRRGA